MVVPDRVRTCVKKIETSKLFKMLYIIINYVCLNFKEEKT